MYETSLDPDNVAMFGHPVRDANTCGIPCTVAANHYKYVEECE